MMWIRKWAMILLVVIAMTNCRAWAEEDPDHFNIEWKWTPAELKTINGIQKQLKQDKEGFWYREKAGITKDERKPYIVKTDISPRFTAEVCLYMDYFLRAFTNIFPVPPAGKVLTRVEVAVYRTRNEYSAATYAPPWSGGVHWVDFEAMGGTTLYIATFPWNLKSGQEPDFCKNFNRGTLQHEGTHAMFRKWSGRALLPVFINEGCATYFEGWYLRVSKPTTAERAARRLRGFHLESLVRKYERQPDFKPSLSKYINISHGAWGSGEISLHYGLAESFADYMLCDRKRRSLFRTMIKRIYKRRVEKVKALTDDEITKLEPGWLEHIKFLVGIVGKKMQEKGYRQREKIRREIEKRFGHKVRTVESKPEEDNLVGGRTGWGTHLKLVIPDGIKLSPRELRECNSPEELARLIRDKLLRKQQ